MPMQGQLIGVGTCTIGAGAQSTLDNSLVWNLDSQGDLSASDAARTFTTEFLLFPPTNNLIEAEGGIVQPNSYTVAAAMTGIDASSNSGVRVSLDVSFDQDRGKFVCDVATWYTSLIYSITFTWWVYAIVDYQ